MVSLKHVGILLSSGDIDPKLEYGLCAIFLLYHDESIDVINHIMIHKKGGRIRTYGRPVPDLLGWVAGLAPLIASVPKIDALCYPARNLVFPTPLLVVPLPIAGIGLHMQPISGPSALDLDRILIVRVLRA
ncbi:hypothetical protein ACH5RR_017845 [Cinchona calisaya]|uniref:Uncharacterized protein n=1 Tax=Cinchona calisaya TaxID=153742 RepID=A0ABD2ZJR1_9GENT